MKNSSRATAAVIAALAGAATLAGADTIDVRFTGTGRGQQVRVTHPGGTMNVFAGQLYHELTNGSGPLGDEIEGTWATYCTDLTQYVTSTVRTYDVVDVALVPNVSPMGVARADALRDLYAFSNGLQGQTGASNDYAAAFQLAVWEIVTDYNAGVGLSSLSITSGSFRATKTDGSALSAGVSAALNTFFGAIGAEGPGASLLGLRSSSAQDQIIPIVPAPGPIALAGLGALCLGMRRRSR